MMRKSKKQQLAEELGKEMTAVVVKMNVSETTDAEERHYNVLENELERYRSELKETRSKLNKARRELTQTHRRLEMLDNDYQEAKHVADKAVRMMKMQLFKWLSPDSRLKVLLFLKFHHQERQLDLLDAMMTYAVTEEKAKLAHPVAQWHFRLFCAMMDSDRFTVPSHSMLVRIWKKIGLLQGIESEE